MICEWLYYTINGAPGGIRTHGLSVRSRTLYPAELRAHIQSWPGILPLATKHIIA